MSPVSVRNAEINVRAKRFDLGFINLRIPTRTYMFGGFLEERGKLLRCSQWHLAIQNNW